MAQVFGTSTNEFLSTAWGSITSLSLDVLIVASSFALILVFAFYFGKGKAIALFLSLYISTFLYTLFPYTDSISLFQIESGYAWSRVLTFAGFVAVLTIIIGNFLTSEFSTRTLVGWFEALLLSTLTLIVLLALSYHILPVSEIYDFGFHFDLFFEPPGRLFWWLVAPLLGLLLISRN